MIPAGTPLVESIKFAIHDFTKKSCVATDQMQTAADAVTYTIKD